MEKHVGACRRWPLGVQRSAVLPVALALAAMTAPPLITDVHAANSSGTQQMTLTTSGGSLTVTAPTNVNVGATPPGTTVSNVALGTLGWQDTLNNGTVSSTSIAMTDFFDSGTSAAIPFTNMSVKIGQTITGRVENTGSMPVAGPAGPFTFSGPDPTPGTSFASVVTLSSASTTSEGNWLQSGNQLNVSVPAATSSGAFVATIQYTITG